MKFKFILSLALAGGTAFASFAEGYKDGVEYYLAGQEKNAETVLNQTINDAQTDKATAYYYLGCIALHKGDNAQAEKYFNLGMQANPENAYNLVGKGALALRTSGVDAAKDFFKQAEKLAKKDTKVRVDIARAYYLADSVKYKENLQKALKDAFKKNKKEPAYFILLGDIDADHKMYGESAGNYENAILYDSENPVGYVKYANTYFHIKPEVAIEKLKEIVAKNPNSALAQRELAEKYFENDQWTMAAQEYKKVIDNPNHFPADEERYVVLLYFGKNYQESFTRAQSLLQANPNSFLMKRMQFLNAAALEKYQEAETYAQTFFASGDADHEFSSNDYTTYGEVLDKLNKEKESLEAYEKAIQINPDKVDLLKDLSAAYTEAARKLNDATPVDTVAVATYYQKAAQYYKQFLDKEKEKSPTEYYLLARRYQNVVATSLDEKAKQEAYTKGLAAVDTALANSDDYMLVRQRALIERVMEGKDISKGLAVDDYNKMIDMLAKDTETEQARKDSACKEAYLYIASYYLANRNVPKAREYYEKYLQLDPNNQQLRDYLQKLK